MELKSLRVFLSSSLCLTGKNHFTNFLGLSENFCFSSTLVPNSIADFECEKPSIGLILFVPLPKGMLVNVLDFSASNSSRAVSDSVVEIVLEIADTGISGGDGPGSLLSIHFTILGFAMKWKIRAAERPTVKLINKATQIGTL